MCEQALKQEDLIALSSLKVTDNSYHMIYQSREQQPKALRYFLDFINEKSIFGSWGIGRWLIERTAITAGFDNVLVFAKGAPQNIANP